MLNFVGKKIVKKDVKPKEKHPFVSIAPLTGRIGFSKKALEIMGIEPVEDTGVLFAYSEEDGSKKAYVLMRPHQEHDIKLSVQGAAVNKYHSRELYRMFIEDIIPEDAEAFRVVVNENLFTETPEGKAFELVEVAAQGENLEGAVGAEEAIEDSVLEEESNLFI